MFNSSTGGEKSTRFSLWEQIPQLGPPDGGGTGAEAPETERKRCQRGTIKTTFMVMDEWEEEGTRRMVAQQVWGAMVTALAASHSEEAEADFWPSWYACWHFCAEKTQTIQDLSALSSLC